MPDSEDLNTAYKVVFPLVLKSEDFGVKVFELGELDRAPVPSKRVAPLYPSYLMKDRVQGTVYVVFIVDEQGKVVRPSIEKSTNSGFNESAISAIRQWKFTPGFKDGNPVKTRVRLPLSFTLKK